MWSSSWVHFSQQSLPWIWLSLSWAILLPKLQKVMTNMCASSKSRFSASTLTISLLRKQKVRKLSSSSLFISHLLLATRVKLITNMKALLNRSEKLSKSIPTRCMNSSIARCRKSKVWSSSRIRSLIAWLKRTRATSRRSTSFIKMWRSWRNSSLRTNRNEPPSLLHKPRYLR